MTERIALLSSDFVDTMENGYFIDKSLLIKDLIDTRSKVTLITRPRRFGKSLNLSMIKTFFEKTEEDNSVYFKGLKIWECGEKYRAEQGKYPVIHMNLKGPAGRSWDKLYSNIKTEIVHEYTQHTELDGHIEKWKVPTFERIVNGTGSDSDYNESLRFLCELLHKFYGVKPIILMDEYDHPIQEAVNGRYYDEAIEFFKPFLSKALKDNKCLSFAVIMGITRVSKEGIFSGLNNLSVCSVLNDRYSQYFGFTEEEVDKILQDYGCSKKKREVREWYNGYRFGTGKTRIYNPWSLINYVMDGCKAKAYWVNTSENGLISGILFDPNAKIRANLTKLVEGESISCKVDENITYRDLQIDSKHIYSLLLMSGYLMCVASEGDMCELTIPNNEVRKVYTSEICDRLCLVDDIPTGEKVSTAIKNKDAKAFRKALERYIATSLNFTLLDKEHAYELLTVGILSNLGGVYYIIPEEKLPRTQSDQVLVPKEKYKDFLPAIVLEYEKCDDEKDLDAKAQAGRNQIDEKEYDIRLRAFGHEDIFKLGVAFCASHVSVKTEYSEMP